MRIRNLQYLHFLTFNQLNMKKVLTLFGVILCTYVANSAPRLFVNEFMASNSTTYATEQGEFEDWVELYNAEDTAIDLAGYYITDNLSNLTKYRFPLTKGLLVVPSKGFILIWADGNPQLGPKHIGFSLSADGESIAVVLPDAVTVVDNFTFPAQKIDFSMGRTTNGGDSWAYLKPASPNASNNSSTAYLGFLPPPVFDIQGGVYTSPIDVSLSTNEPGAQIIYTTDGSLPDPQNVDGDIFRYKNNYQYLPTDTVGGFLYDTSYTLFYNQSIHVVNRSNNPNTVGNKASNFAANPSAYMPTGPVRKATLIRARTVKPGYISSDVEAHSYFITETPNNIGYRFPVFSLAIPQKYLYSWDTGIYNAGVDFEVWRASNPASTPTILSPANWERKTEFPISLEYFSANAGERLFHHNAGFRLQGSGSSANPQKSLRLYFRSDYGKSDIGYPIFPTGGFSNYNRVILRNNGTEFGTTFNPQTTYVRDMALQTAVRQMNFPTQLSTPSVVFINGEYWGIHIIYERFDRFYFEQKFGIKEGELDLIEIRDGVEEGDGIHYNNMLNFIKNQDVSQPHIYDSINKLMDIDNYIDYQSAEIYFNNIDWPHNNIRHFRKKTNYDSLAPYGQDGRWRWVLYDMDRAAGDGYFANKLSTASTVPHPYNIILGRLLTNPTFKEKFISRYLDLSNTAFRPDFVNHIVDSIKALLLPEMPEHIRRWRSSPPSINTWNSNISRMTTFINRRPEYSILHLQEKFATDTTFAVNLNVSDTAAGFIKVNTINIERGTAGVSDTPYPWTGVYLGGVPVRLLPIAKPGYRFVRWEGDTTTTADTLIIIPDSDNQRSVIAVFEKGEPVIPPQIVHYWHFNNLPSGNLDNLPADSSVIGGTLITYPGTGDGYMDRTNSTEGSELNAQYGQPAGQALRVRNPSHTRSLVFATPSTGFKDISISYAIQRTGSGAQYQRISYSPNNGTDWKLIKDSVVINETFELQSFNLSDSAGTANNASLIFKIEFLGTNAAGASGNNRFDNFLLTGIPETIPPQIVHYWHFNNLPSGNLDNLPADSSVIGGTLISYPGSGAGYMDRTNATEGSEINAQYDQPLGQALRVRNPANTRTLLFQVPTTGFKNIAISYAAQRTNNGAQYQRLSYSANGGDTWTLIKDSVVVSEAFELQEFNLSDSTGTSNNPSLLFKVDFLGTNASGSSGNNRFDNFLVTGQPTSIECRTGDWLGVADTDWFNPANWCGGIPAPTDSVTISAGKTHYPLLTAPVVVKTLVLKNGGSLTLEPNVILTIEGGICEIKGEMRLGTDSQLNIKK
jgi:hypothetical protein